MEDKQELEDFEMIQQKIGRMGYLSGFDLKILAVVTMLVDHVGAILFPEVLWLRCVGRLAFPIFAFLLVEGFLHTRDVDAYLKRLFVFAVLSEIVFDYAFFGQMFYIRHQNIFFTLCLGLFLIKKLREDPKDLHRFLWLLGTVLAADVLRTDYGGAGVLTVLVFYQFRNNKTMTAVCIGAIHILMLGWIQSFAVLALLPIFLYNGERGRNVKYFFYTFYPVHLIFLLLLKMVVFG